MIIKEIFEQIKNNLQGVIIFLILLFQAIVAIYIHPVRSDENFLFYSYFIALFAPWIYFIFYYYTDIKTVKFQRFLPNEKTASIVINALKIKTYDTKTLINEYLNFISNKPCYKKETDMWYILIDKGQDLSPRVRSIEARSYDFITFCIALEIRNLCDRVECLFDPYTYFKEEHSKQLIQFASRFFGIELIHYSNTFLYLFGYNEYNIEQKYNRIYDFNYNPAVETLLLYIRECFFKQKKPDYIEYLNFSIEEIDGYKYPEVLKNFKTLLSECKTK